MLPSLQTRITDKEIAYDGLQLDSHWICREFNLLGDAIVAFEGKSDVPISHMVDLEDVKANAPIYSPRMLHFVAEWFIDSWTEGLLLQYLFVQTLYASLWEKGIENLNRRGNDIYFKGRKLNVSIATKTIGSVLMHTGVNIRTENTPVPTAGLLELQIQPLPFAESLLTRFQEDLSSLRRSRVKCLTR